MVFEESFNRPSLVRTAPVPQKNEPSFKMSQKIAQKGKDLGIPNVFQGVKAGIQGDSRLSGRDANRGDSGYFRPSAGDLKDRRLSNGRPGLSDSRDKTKSALIEEDQRDFKFFGLFLYAAKYVASIFLFPFHLVLWLWSRVSDGSSATLAGFSKHAPDDKPLRNAYRSLWPLFPTSTGQWSSRFLAGLPQAFAPASVSGARLVSQASRARVLTSMPYHRSSFADHPSNTPNLTSNRVSQLSPADSFRYPRALWPAVYAFQALFGFHGVAWRQYTMFLLLMRESIAF